MRGAPRGGPVSLTNQTPLKNSRRGPIPDCPNEEPLSLIYQANGSNAKPMAPTCAESSEFLASPAIACTTSRGLLPSETVRVQRFETFVPEPDARYVPCTSEMFRSHSRAGGWSRVLRDASGRLRCRANSAHVRQSTPDSGLGTWKTVNARFRPWLSGRSS